MTLDEMLAWFEKLPAPERDVRIDAIERRFRGIVRAGALGNDAHFSTLLTGGAGRVKARGYRNEIRVEIFYPGGKAVQKAIHDGVRVRLESSAGERGRL